MPEIYKDIKVCHLTSSHVRFDTRIFQKECRSLSKAGYDVSLIVADGKGSEVVDKVKIFDIGKKNTRFKQLVTISNKIRILALNLNCDIYHFHDPELIFVGLSLRKAGKHVIFDMHENILGQIVEKKYIPFYLRKIVSFLYKKLENYSVKRFDGIVVTLQSVKDRLVRYNANIELITNYPDFEENIEKTPSDETIICFAGLIGPNYKHKEIIKAIENFENIKYLLAGPVENDYLQELKSLKGWDKVEYWGVVSRDRVFEMYKKATVGVVIHIYSKNTDGKNGSLSVIKLFECMNWGIPVICTDYVLWKEIVEKQEKCGICVNPYDANELHEAIKFLIENPEIAINMGKRGRKAVINKYNWQEQEKILFKLYQKALND